MYEKMTTARQNSRACFAIAWLWYFPETNLCCMYACMHACM